MNSPIDASNKTNKTMSIIALLGSLPIITTILFEVDYYRCSNVTCWQHSYYGEHLHADGLVLDIGFSPLITFLLLIAPIVLLIIRSFNPKALYLEKALMLILGSLGIHNIITFLQNPAFYGAGLISLLALITFPISTVLIVMAIVRIYKKKCYKTVAISALSFNIIARFCFTYLYGDVIDGSYWGIADLSSDLDFNGGMIVLALLALLEAILTCAAVITFVNLSVKKEVVASMEQRLIALNNLRENGFITDEEYTTKRAELLNNL